MARTLIKIALLHGFRARLNLSGGVDVFLPWTRGEESGVDVVTVRSLSELKIVLGY